MINSQPHVISVSNQKGGVGKTTTAINLGTSLAAVGKKVLLVDLDPQGNASTGLGIEVKERKNTTYDVILGTKTLSETIKETKVPGLHIAPSNTDLSSADIDLSQDRKRVLRLKESLTGDLFNSLDYVLIDCPPALNILTVNAFVASTSVLVPLQTEFFALEGLSQLILTIQEVRKNLNKNLKIHGIVLTMYDRRNKLSSQVEQEARDYFKDKVYQTVIPRNVRLSEAPSHGIPVLIYDKNCPGSKSYYSFTDEFMAQENKVGSAA